MTLQELICLHAPTADALITCLSNQKNKVAATVHVTGKTSEVRPDDSDQIHTRALLQNNVNPDGTYEFPGIPLTTYSGKTRDLRPTRVAELPRMPCVIGGTPDGPTTDAILDSGSQANVVSWEYAENHKLPRITTKSTVQGICGPDQPYAYESISNIWVGGHSVPIHVFVLPTGVGNEDILLGLPFIMDSQAILEFGDNPTVGRINIIFGKTRLLVPTGDLAVPRRSNLPVAI